MNAEREQILTRAREALAPLTHRASLPDWESELIHLRQTQAAGDPWERFSERLRAVNGTPLNSIDSLAALLEKHGWLRGYCDPALWSLLGEGFTSRFTVSPDFDRHNVDQYDFGITCAAGAIAETGTLILTDGSTSSRLGALAPWVHVAVLRRAQIHADISAALAALPPDPNIIWITGPSKTADVEGILIEGVHGPGMQVALLID